MSEPAKVTEVVVLCNICGLLQHGGDCLSAVKDELYAYKLVLAQKSLELAEAKAEIEMLNRTIKEWELWKESNT